MAKIVAFEAAWDEATDSIREYHAVLDDGTTVILPPTVEPKVGETAVNKK